MDHPLSIRVSSLRRSRAARPFPLWPWLFPVFFLLFFSPAPLAAEESLFLAVEARSGDGVYSLLRRYDLDDHACNLEKFYDLNALKRGSHLVAHRRYRLPIMLYTFNGRSIRSTVGLNNWDRALRIQHFNETMVEARLRERPFQEDKQLWVPYHELFCDEEARAATVSLTAAASPPARTYPIFGPDHAHTPKVSDRLAGQVFYVVSGHGGPDPGAMAQRSGNTLCEDEYAYDVALRLCRHLIAHGATAYMITRDEDDGIRSGSYLPCDYDERLWGGIEMVRPLKARLFQRSDVVNSLYQKHILQGQEDQKLLIIHVDSRRKGKRIDLFFYHREGDEQSRHLARNLHQVMTEKYSIHRANGQYHGSVSPRDLHMLRETKPTPVYIELGNIRNGLDQTRIVLESNRELLAQWLFEGLVRE
jgi:N-acetylmuramoyl-L-alanine amidase